MRSLHAALVALALLALSSQQGARAEVVLVYSVQRHGARNALPKTSLLKESAAAGGPTLLPEGERQAYNAGLAYRARYLNASACAGLCLGAAPAPQGPEYGVVNTPGGTWNNYNTLVRSSSLDRTIMTARTFLAAVFPPIDPSTPSRYLPDGSQVVPVYSLPEDYSPLIRGYSSCPTYDRRLAEWYGSPEFAAKAAETQAFRDAIGTESGLNASLANWWNVYDGYSVYRTYNVSTPVPAVDDATFQKIEELANWLETAKMRSSLTSNLLAGPMLADLLNYVEAAATAAAAAASTTLPSIYYKLLHISSHYNTQLGVLGALGIDQTAAAGNVTFLSKIPELASILAFELHSDGARPTAQFAVRLVAQDGPTAAYETIPLPCAAPGDGAEALAGRGACSLDAFRALAHPRALNSTAQWCDACENANLLPCQLRLAGKQLTAAGMPGSGTAPADSASASASGSSSLSGGAVAGIVVGCVAAVALLGGAAFFAHHRRVQRQLAVARLQGVEEGGPWTAA